MVTRDDERNATDAEFHFHLGCADVGQIIRHRGAFRALSVDQKLIGEFLQFSAAHRALLGDFEARLASEIGEICD